MTARHLLLIKSGTICRVASPTTSIGNRMDSWQYDFVSETQLVKIVFALLSFSSMTPLRQKSETIDKLASFVLIHSAPDWQNYNEKCSIRTFTKRLYKNTAICSINSSIVEEELT
jgi:hypothetical protein